MTHNSIHSLARYFQPHLLFAPELQIVALIKNHIKGKRLLDAGCGNGWLSLAFAREGYHVVSLDVSKDSVRQTTYGFRLFGPDKCEIVQASITNIPLSSKSFDTVICLNVLEHIIDIAKALGELNRVLVPAGRLIVVVPNKLTFGRVYDKFLYRCLPAQKILRKARRAMFELKNNEVTALGLGEEVPIGHVQELSFKDMTMLLRNNNFRIINYCNYRLLGPYFRSLTNFLGMKPVTLLERFDLKIAQKAHYLLASEWFFCAEKVE